MTLTDQTARPAVELERAPCEICGADMPQPVAARADLLFGGPTVYTMCRCGSCGVLYQHPRPTAATIGNLYPPDTSYPSYRKAVQAEPLLKRIDRRYGLAKRCRLVTRHHAPGRLLDVGCATGDFISEMRRQPGWEIVGVEPGPSAARYAAATTGVPVVRGVLNDASFADGSFDVVTMWDVLEHVYQPRAVIAEAARLLRPGGLLIVNHPNTESVDRALFGRLWVGYELPRHLYLFPPELLRSLVAEHGLREVEQVCFYGSHAAAVDSLIYAVEQRIGRGQASAALRKLLRSLPVRVAAAPYFVIADRLRRGSNVTAVFVRG
jgi:2-polyprenyl-3-methyl-5-hydroxy-6-metoxy-1,4-benzoquinol methylase